jgi:hypothetical protein
VEGDAKGSEVYLWARNFYIISQRLNITVESVTAKPYLEYLFWVTFFKEYDREQEKIQKKYYRR